MSRTRRNIPTSTCRRPQHITTRKAEASALDDIIDNDFNPTNRLKYRANPCSDAIPNEYDDLNHAAWDELDFNKFQILEE